MGKDKNDIRHRGLKELTFTTHGHELKWGMLEGWGAGWMGDKGEEIGKTVIA